VKLISTLIALFSILVLTACSQNPPTNPPKVERFSLIRSMTYTHRHLLEQQLGAELGKQDSEQILLQSHCDLIKRGVVRTEPLPESCQPLAPQEVQICIAEFHRCIGSCGTFMRDCPPCEKRAERCLGRATVDKAGV
jgi:hypothetical protein